jgi:DNA-binding transcriptional regulator YdaS (Cro superfamily)
MSKTHDPIPREALERAAQVLGSRKALATRLDVPLEELERWLKGDGRPPPKIVFAALALVESSGSAR